MDNNQAHRVAASPLPAPEVPLLQLSITKPQLAELPVVTFPGKVSVIEYETQALEALDWLSRQKIVGFDTETRPSFRKGRVNNPSLIQISTPGRCMLFRINKLGLIPALQQFLEDDSIKKIGLSLKDDFNALRRITPGLEPQGFIELQSFVRDYNIVDASLQKIYGIIFGRRISKNQRLSNWEADQLTEGQQHYAAIDAWASLRIYTHLLEGSFDPTASPYILTPPTPDDDASL